jgi:hypothetical protein
LEITPKAMERSNAEKDVRNDIFFIKTR